MSNQSNFGKNKKERVIEIKSMLNRFCQSHLNEELEGYAAKLCEELSRKRKIDILRGRKKIWAASIIYVIARLNFLFDEENENHVTADTICHFFDTNKSTIGKKATQIENICNLTIGAEGYCSKEIRDALAFYQTPEGFILPKEMMEDREIIVEFVEGEEAEEIRRFVENELRIKEEKARERRERRIEINRKIAEKKKGKKRNKNQLNLFDDF